MAYVLMENFESNAKMITVKSNSCQPDVTDGCVMYPTDHCMFWAKSKKVIFLLTFFSNHWQLADIDRRGKVRQGGLRGS